MVLCSCREITLLKEHARDWRFSTKRVVSELPEIAGGDYCLPSDDRQVDSSVLCIYPPQKRSLVLPCKLPLNLCLQLVENHVQLHLTRGSL